MYNPYANGRWCRFFIESDGSDLKLTESDIEGAEINSTVLDLGDYKIKNIVYDIHTIGIGTSNRTLGLKCMNGHFVIILPQEEAFDYGYIYAFCEKL